VLDTPNNILDKQREILFQKSIAERFLIGAEVIDFGRVVVESSIRRNHPTISKIDLKVEVFKRYYTSVFSTDELERIIQSMVKYYYSKHQTLDK